MPYAIRTLRRIPASKAVRPSATTRVLAATALAAAAAGIAQAQYPVPRSDGRLFDANPQIGASRFYDARPITPLLQGNLAASGNLRGGLALRSFSPIPDPLAFRAGLGSGALSGFIRDSISVADRYPYGASFPVQPFFDPARTVPTGGFLTGQYLPGPLSPRPSFNVRDVAVQQAPGLLDYSQPIDRRIHTDLLASPSADSVARNLATDLTSSLFGVNRPVLPKPTDQIGNVSDLLARDRLPTDPRRADVAAPEDPTARAAATLASPLDRSTLLDRSGQPLGSPLDLLLSVEPGKILDRPVDLLGPTVPLAAGEPFRPAPAAPGTRDRPDLLTGKEAAEALRPTPTVLPGQDVFTDLQLSLSLERNPSAEWFRDMQAAIRENPTLPEHMRTMAALDAMDFIGRVLKSPMRTFAGEGPSPVNEALREAEALMDEGRYFDAVRRYERAQAFDPLNPLPVIGRGHALLAAGNYNTAAVSLAAGLGRFPELARFAVDLQALMGGGEVIDIRRSDLIRQLERREDPRLRFLLGYLEYHSGQREKGLENLRKAAAQSEPGSLISRYPDMLTGHGPLPPPKLPGSDEGTRLRLPDPGLPSQPDNPQRGGD
jgi:hypothetical protein